MKKTRVALVAAMVCCATTPSTATPAADKSGILGFAFPSPGSDPAVVDTNRDRFTASDRPVDNRPLGAAGQLCMLLTVLGGLVVMVAGYLLIRARRTDRDGRYILLCMAGYGMLVTAAFGLILLNR